MKTSIRILPLIPLLPLLLSACGEDRSGEQPFKPEVVTLSADGADGSAVLRGAVTASTNSMPTGCGFRYGNDTLRASAPAELPGGPGGLGEFTTTVEPLLPGDYYAVAYATNPMGTTYGDTLRFSVE